MAKIPSRKFSTTKKKIPSRKFAKSTRKIASRKLASGTAKIASRKLASRKLSNRPKAVAREPRVQVRLDRTANAEERQERLDALQDNVKSLRMANELKSPEHESS